MRTFIVKNSSSYLRMFLSHVMPILTYCSVIWSPSAGGPLESLENVQRKFLHRVERRCEITRDSLALPQNAEVHKACDIRYLRTIVGNDEIFDQLFDLRSANTRRGFFFSAKDIATTTVMNNLFPWRVTSRINLDK